METRNGAKRASELFIREESVAKKATSRSETRLHNEAYLLAFCVFSMRVDSL